jgi:FAD/FMN-containing dehydrogenase
VGEAVDRRSFLAALGAGGAALFVGGCGSSGAGARRPRVAPAAPRTPAKLSQAIRGPVISRGQPGFSTAAHVYNERFDGVLPQAVARPISGADVQAAVNWCVAHDVPMRARSGGHSYAGYSTIANGVVLDLRQLTAIAVDTRAGTATIGAGAALVDVYTQLAQRGVTIPAGSCPSVGVAGHALGGGMGLAGRHLGLAADNILAAKIVTADGRLRTLNSHTDPDLLWALRGGGGGNFGVVTELTFKVHPIPSSAAYYFVDFPWSSASAAIDAWLTSAPHATELATSILHLNAAGSPSVSVSGQFFGSSAALGPVLAQLRQVAGATVTTGEESYLGLQMRWAGCLSTPLAACHTVGTRPGGTLQRASFNAKSDYLTSAVPAAGRAVLLGLIEQRAASPGSGAILFDAYGGAINRVAPTATAFVHRDTLCCLQYLTYGGDDAWLAQAHGAMRPYVSGMAYQNYIDASLTGWQQAYYGANYARLEATRRRVDPNHLFNFPQAIGR